MRSIALILPMNIIIIKCIIYGISYTFRSVCASQHPSRLQHSNRLHIINQTTERCEKGVEWTKDATIDKKHEYQETRSVQSILLLVFSLCVPPFYFFLLFHIHAIFYDHIQISTHVLVHLFYYVIASTHQFYSFFIPFFFSLSLCLQDSFFYRILCAFFFVVVEILRSQTEININHSLFHPHLDLSFRLIVRCWLCAHVENSTWASYNAQPFVMHSPRSKPCTHWPAQQKKKYAKVSRFRPLKLHYTSFMASESRWSGCIRVNG